jgi:hypothetical protein
MADLVQTAANVVPGTPSSIQQGTAGVSITQGQTVYLDAASGTLKLANATTSLASATVAGIALNSALAGQPVSYLTSGQLVLGAILTAGKVYVNSTNSGNMAPIADLASGMRTTILGFAINTTTLQVGIVNSGVVN